MSGGRAPGAEHSGVSTDFSARLVDGFFMRWLWYVLPVVVLSIIGVTIAQGKDSEFVAEGTLSASVNPLVGQAEVRGITINNWETPASGTARLITEQLRTDAFLMDVAERAGVAELLRSGVITPAVLRKQVWATASGEAFLKVNAAWDDSQTAFLLVDATINAYVDYVAETVASDSLEAITFYGKIEQAANVQADAAEKALIDYLQAHPEPPENGVRDTAEVLTITRLNSTLDSALKAVDDAQGEIDRAQLNVEQAQSEAGRQLRIIDAPRVPSAPQSNTIKRLVTMFLFTLLGLLMSFAALMATTVLDRSIRSRTQLAKALQSTNVTASIPELRSLARASRNSASSKKAA